MIRSGIIFILVLFLALSCSSPPEDTLLTENPNKQMATDLRMIFDTTPPLANWPNPRRADEVLKMVNNAQGRRKLQLQIQYARELLNVGRTEEAIQVIETQIIDFGGDIRDIDPRIKSYYDLLAIAYLRLGEQQNCIANHSAESCIIPIQGKGLHTLKEGSTRAIELFEALLKLNPRDMQSRWLLNLAYMTLDMYPESVPTDFLIPGLKPDDSIVPRFQEIAGNLGLDINGLSGGVAADDFNNDGFLDLMVSAYGLTEQIELFFSNGDGSFRNSTAESNLTGITGGMNILPADYDNDGYVDVFVLRGAWFGKYGSHPNSLLRNMGDGTFRDVTREAGVYSLHPTQTASWADFNLDGHIDLFIGNETNVDQVHPCELFVNNGDGTFDEIAEKVGLDISHVYSKGVVWGDINNDMLPDLYLSNLVGPNRLFLNKGGRSSEKWKFEEITESAGVTEPQFSLPTWFWDFNQDGWEDIFVSGYDPGRFEMVATDETSVMLGMDTDAEKPRIYLNNGDNTFTDVAAEYNVDRVLYSMGSNYGDLNNDGYPDFYAGTGSPHFGSVVPNRMFLNQSGERFEDITFQGGFGHIQKGHGVTFSDFDNDGDQDVYAVMGGAYAGDVFQNALFENPGFGNSWITLRLEGVKSNRCAIGARITVIVRDNTGNERTIYMTVSSGGSFGANSLQQEIGLGSATEVVEITIQWPNSEKTIDVYKDLQPGKFYKIIEGSSEAVEIDVPIAPFMMEQHMHHSN